MFSNDEEFDQEVANINNDKINDIDLLGRMLETIMHKLKANPELADFSHENLTYLESCKGDVAIIVYNNNPKTIIDSATLIVVEAVISWIADWEIIWHPQLNFQGDFSNKSDYYQDKVESIFLLIFKSEYQKLQTKLEQFYRYNDEEK
ncbi:MAG: hypothetical protein ACRCZW_11960 [Lactobacillaceae bacterium]